MSSKTIGVRFRRYFMIEKSTPHPIKSKDVSVQIESKVDGESGNDKSKAEPNFFALCVLWAHFEACKQGLMKEIVIPPWEQYRDIKEDPGVYGESENFEEHDENNLWTNFLKMIISDDNWTEWIKSPNEVKRRSIEAYKRMLAHINE